MRNSSILSVKLLNFTCRNNCLISFQEYLVLHLTGVKLLTKSLVKLLLLIDCNNTMKPSMYVKAQIIVKNSRKEKSSMTKRFHLGEPIIRKPINVPFRFVWWKKRKQTFIISLMIEHETASIFRLTMNQRGADQTCWKTNTISHLLKNWYLVIPNKFALWQTRAGRTRRKWK